MQDKIHVERAACPFKTPMDSKNEQAALLRL